MNAVSNGQEVSLVDRGTLGTLLAFSAIAKTTSDLAAEVATSCIDGSIDDRERQRLRVAALIMRTQLGRLEAVIG